MKRAGFTLVELLVAIAIVGILVALSVQRYLSTKQSALLAAMKSDLHNLMTAEAAFYSDSGKFTTTIGPGGVTFRVSAGNTTPVITLTSDGWTAQLGGTTTTKTCAIFVGTTPLAPAVKEGEPRCT